MRELLIGTDERLILHPRWAISPDRHSLEERDGEGWRAVAGDDLALHCLVAVGDRVVVGTELAHLRSYDGAALEPVKSFDEAEGRDSWYTPWGAPATVRSLAADDDGGLFVNVHVGGVVRSLDGGDSWAQTLDIDVDVHQVIAHEGFVLAACGDGGLATSRDRGATWTFATEGLHGTYCRAVAVAGDSVLVSASSGPFSKEGAVYKRMLGGDGDFERVTADFPFNIDTFQLGAAGDDAAFVTDQGELWRSSDRGTTWTLEATDLATPRSVIFV